MNYSNANCNKLDNEQRKHIILYMNNYYIA